MSVRSIQKSLIEGRFTVFVSILIFLVLRFAITPDRWNDEKIWGTTLVQIGVSLVLLQINHVFTVIRSRTFLPVLFYLLFTGTNPSLYSELTGSIVAFCVVLCLIFLFASYQEPQSQIQSLNVSLVLTLGSFLWSPVLLFFPLFWYGFYRFRSFNARVFFAGLTGIFIIYLFVFAWSLYRNDWTVFLSRLPHWNEMWISGIPSLCQKEWIIAGFLFILYVVSGTNLFLSGISEKIRTVSFLSYLYIIVFVGFVFLLLQSEWKETWALIVYAPLSFVLAHFFTLSTKKITAYLLIVCMLFFLGMYGWWYFFPCA